METAGWNVSPSLKRVLKRATLRRGRHCADTISGVVSHLIDKKKLDQLIADDQKIMAERN